MIVQASDKLDRIFSGCLIQAGDKDRRNHVARVLDRLELSRESGEIDGAA